MRGFFFTFMAMLLVLSNIVLAADMHAEAFSGRHHPEPALHADDPCDQGEQHAQCHHCCHAQAHFYSLTQHAHSDWFSAGHDWVVSAIVQPHPLDQAPPVPPPKV